MDKRIVGLLLFTLAFTCYSQETEEWQTLTDDRDSWIVAVSMFRGPDLSPERQYLLQSVPAIILDKIRTISPHTYSTEEMEGYKRTFLERLISDMEKQLTNTISGKDRQRIFQNKDVTDDSEDETVLDYREKLRYYRTVPLEYINVSDTKEISLFTQGDEEIIPYPVDIPLFCGKNDIDLFISGEIEEIGDYLFFQISAYSTALNTVSFYYENATKGNDVLEKIESCIPELITQLYGREWNILTISTVPDEARIYLDGEYQGIGGLRKILFEYSDIIVTAEAAGFQTAENVISSTRENITDLSIELEQKELSRIIVNSYPNDADVYVSAEWVGKTPLFLTIPEDYTHIVLIKNGYQDYNTVLAPDHSIDVAVTLNPVLYDEKTQLKAVQDDLYLSLGLFNVVLPFTIFSFSLASDYYDQNETEISTPLFVSGSAFLFTNLALFANVILDIVEYLAFAEKDIQ